MPPSDTKNSKKVKFEESESNPAPAPRSRASAPKKAKSKANAWGTHLDKTYKAGRKKDPKYLYSAAMQDAKVTYKRK